MAIFLCFKLAVLFNKLEINSQNSIPTQTVIYLDYLTLIAMASHQMASQLESGPESHELNQPSVDAQPSQAPLSPTVDVQPSQSRWTNPDLLNGFPQTAQFLAADPDKSAVIFRRFDKLSIRNLLNLEGRVAALESIQKKLDRDDNDQHWQNDHIAAAAQSWEDFAVLGTEMGHRSTEDSIPHGAYKMWNQTREKRLAVQREIAESLKMNQSGHLPSAINTDSTELLNRSEETRQLIQLRWDVAVAIKHAVKEYRNSLFVIKDCLTTNVEQKKP